MILSGATIVTPSKLIEAGALVVRRGKIAEILDHPVPNRTDVVNSEGCFILPGLVDTHSDVIEDEIEPRRGALLPEQLVLLSLDARLASLGVTTVFHALHTLGISSGRRSANSARRLMGSLRSGLAEGMLRINHLVTLRCELSDSVSVRSVKELMHYPIVMAVSLQDHTPGPSQSEDQFRDYCRAQLRMQEQEIRKFLSRKLEGRIHLWTRAKAIAKRAVRNRLVLLSHDDARIEDLLRFRRLGTSVSEFPTNLEVCEKAREVGAHVCIGAPNLVIGHSQSGNVSAEAVIKNKLADLLCSDYYPPSLLAGVFKAWSNRLATPSEVVNMATKNGAVAMGVHDRGSIEVGTWADIIVVRIAGHVPEVAQTYYAGKLIYSRPRR